MARIALDKWKNDSEWKDFVEEMGKEMIPTCSSQIFGFLIRWYRKVCQKSANKAQYLGFSYDKSTHLYDGDFKDKKRKDVIYAESQKLILEAFEGQIPFIVLGDDAMDTARDLFHVNHDIQDMNMINMFRKKEDRTVDSSKRETYLDADDEKVFHKLAEEVRALMKTMLQILDSAFCPISVLREMGENLDECIGVRHKECQKEFEETLPNKLVKENALRKLYFCRLVRSGRNFTLMA